MRGSALYLIRFGVVFFCIRDFYTLRVYTYRIFFNQSLVRVLGFAKGISATSTTLNFNFVFALRLDFFLTSSRRPSIYLARCYVVSAIIGATIDIRTLIEDRKDWEAVEVTRSVYQY